MGVENRLSSRDSITSGGCVKYVVIRTLLLPDKGKKEASRVMRDSLQQRFFIKDCADYTDNPELNLRNQCNL